GGLHPGPADHDPTHAAGRRHPRRARHTPGARPGAARGTVPAGPAPDRRPGAADAAAAPKRPGHRRGTEFPDPGGLPARHVPAARAGGRRRKRAGGVRRPGQPGVRRPEGEGPMISPAPTTWEEANQRYLTTALALVRAALERHVARVQDAVVELPEAGAGQALDEAAAAMPAPPALETLCATFGLSPFERAVLVLCAGQELDSRFAALCAAAQG